MLRSGLARALGPPGRLGEPTLSLRQLAVSFPGYCWVISADPPFDTSCRGPARRVFDVQLGEPAPARRRLALRQLGVIVGRPRAIFLHLVLRSWLAGYAPAVRRACSLSRCRLAPAAGDAMLGSASARAAGASTSVLGLAEFLPSSASPSFWPQASPPRTSQTDPAPTPCNGPSIADCDGQGSAPSSECRAHH